MTATFAPAPDGIDPSRVPSKVLPSGAKIPVVGLGTFGSDHVTGQQIADAVYEASTLGYRHFDCASVYGNEDMIGHSFQKMLRGGVKREELWITSKLWNDKHAEKDVIPSCEKSLKDLQLDYLDLYLIHWPFPNYHPPGCAPDYHNPDACAYIHDNYMKTWRQMEKLVESGKVRHIGTSNMTIPKLELLLRDAAIKPVCNEMELHPHLQQPELFDYVVAQGIVPIGYSPIGSPGPARARPHAGRHGRHRRSGDRPHRAADERASRRGLPEMGDPARRGGHSVLGQSQELSQQPEGGDRRLADRAGHDRHS